MAITVCAVAPAAAEQPQAAVLAARESVVRIRSAGVGAGFVFHSRRHVATAFHVVERGAPMVELRNGDEIPARVVAYAPRHDLAILELEREVDVEPLELQVAIPIGAPVFAIGHPYDGGAPNLLVDLDTAGLLEWSIVRGIVSSRSNDILQIDAPINPGNSGGPLVDEAGRVVGVVSRKLGGDGVGFAIRSHRLRELVGRIGRQEPYSFGHGVSVRVGVGLFDDVWGGMTQLDVPIILALQARASLGVFSTEIGSATEVSPDEVSGRDLTAILGELGVEYRWFFFVPMEAGLGGSVAGTWGERTRLSFGAPDPSCDPRQQDCAVDVTRRVTDLGDIAFRAMAFASITPIDPLILGYAFHLDLEDAGDSVHRLWIGIRVW